MENNVIIIFTEGDHDAAFLYRILKSNGYNSFTKAIKDFPAPLDMFLQSDIKNVTIPELKIQEYSRRFLPSEVLQNGCNFLLIYSVGGESKDKVRIDLVNAINSLNVKDSDAIQVSPNVSFSFLYFFDADTIGTEKRMEQVTEELKKSFPGNTILDATLPVFTKHTLEDLNIGTYIFKESGTDSGMLEDVLIPLMREGNDDIFEKAIDFISIHPNTKLFKSVLQFDIDNNLQKVNRIKFSKKKSLIGTVGQLQKSGKSNTICIRETDYLNDEKILENSTCKEIYDFIQQFVK